MKTLVNCKPTEFLVQTNKIRKSVEEWLTATDIMNIRKRLPKDLPKELPRGASKEEVRKNLKKTEEMFKEQQKRNLSAILDAMLEENAEETLKIIALCCFVEPKDVDNYPVSFYLQGFTEIIGDESVLNFFTSLARLGVTNISNVPTE